MTAPIRFHANLLPMYFPDRQPPFSEYFQDILEEVQLAEELGFEGFWFTEHHFLLYGGPIPNPAVFISAAAGTTDRAVTLLPIVLVFLLVLALGSVFPLIGKRPVLNQLGYVASTQWAFAGFASTVDPNDLQAVSGVLTRVESVRVDNPEPLFRAVGKGDRGDPRWDHDTGAWLTACGALLGLTLVPALAAGLALRRGDTGRRIG
jgi:hypothetical protein